MRSRLFHVLKRLPELIINSTEIKTMIDHSPLNYYSTTYLFSWFVSIFEVDVTSFYQQMLNTNPYPSANHNQKNNPNHKTNPKKTLILTLKRRKSEGQNGDTSV